MTTLTFNQTEKLNARLRIAPCMTYDEGLSTWGNLWSVWMRENWLSVQWLCTSRQNVKKKHQVFTGIMKRLLPTALTLLLSFISKWKAQEKTWWANCRIMLNKYEFKVQHRPISSLTLTGCSMVAFYFVSLKAQSRLYMETQLIRAQHMYISRKLGECGHSAAKTLTWESKTTHTQ